MSGMKNLANALANDPSFAKQTKGVMTKAESDQIVCAPAKGSGSAPRGDKASAPKAKGY